MKKQGPAKKRAMERLQETMAKMRTPSDRIQIFRTFRKKYRPLRLYVQVR